MAAGGAKAKGGGKGRAGPHKGTGKAAPEKAAGARSRAKPAGPKAADGPWATAALVAVLAVLVLRLGINALGPIPVHFDEAQYWAYGQELDWGYYSKPPLVAWAVRAATDLFGDTLFGLRFLSPVAHAGIAWLIFLTGRRLWDPGTGFWAALGYTAAPGVGLSAMIMSTDPLLMLAWAAALYAAVRAMAGDGRLWWLVLGTLVGLGALAKYTMVAFVGGGLGYALFSARARDWRGAGLAAAAALAVMAPNLYWNGQHAFVTFGHVAGDADPGHGYFHPARLAEFAGAQFGVIGPVFMAAILLAFWHRGRWRDDWAMRLMAWQTAPLLLAMLALALATRANANWAAPAYVAGALMAARWLVLAGGLRAAKAQLGIGIVASLGLWTLAGLYAGQADKLTRRMDPFVQMRLSEPFCEIALGAMGDEGVGVLLSDDRRRLSECMFQGGLGWDEVAIWNPDDRPDNHHELVASLHPGDQRELLLMVLKDGAPIAHHFAEAREVESGRLATHLDRDFPFSIWVVQGFKGY